MFSSENFNSSLNLLFGVNGDHLSFAGEAYTPSLRPIGTILFVEKFVVISEWWVGVVLWVIGGRWVNDRCLVGGCLIGFWCWDLYQSITKIHSRPSIVKNIFDAQD